MAAAVNTITHLLCATLLTSGSGNTFLEAKHPMREEHISEEDVQTSLLSEIEGEFGEGSATSRLADLKALLSPMYAALPKNEYGGIGHATVRYALHRLFVQRHGWSIRGLDPAGGAWNSTSPTGILKDQVPAYIQDLFEKRLGGRGFKLHELAVMAATIEHLIHTEAITRLGLAMRVHDLLPTAIMSVEHAEQVLDTYTVSYLLGEDLSNMTADDAQNMSEEMPEVYPAWPETQEFVRSTRRDFANSSEITFAMLSHVAEKVGEQFGKFQDRECKRLKHVLVSSEEKGDTGRVRLSDFYRPALEGKFQFHENVNYLRELGALDESNPKHTRVMMANYITSQSNCIASSAFYSVCCMNECENLMGRIEQQLVAPDAIPEQLIAIVSKLSSSSVHAPRELSADLREHLHEIATQHSGRVPVHGRLFAQWMHHTFARECPYPHVAHATKPLNPDDWEELEGDSEATEEEMRNYTDAILVGEDADGGDLVLPWSHEEELLSYIPASHRARGPSSSALLFAVVLSGALGVVRLIEKTGNFGMAETERVCV